MECMMNMRTMIVMIYLSWSRTLVYGNNPDNTNSNHEYTISYVI